MWGGKFLQQFKNYLPVFKDVPDISKRSFKKHGFS